ncbi:MAG: hypothetical protein ACE5FM_06360, partial [Methyloligellaceae bacterium]
TLSYSITQICLTGADVRHSLDTGGSRALMFSVSTRNSLVVLPLALAVPFGGGLVAAVVITQTLVELLAELVYIRLIPRFR